ncbi:MAG TPA: outer membrane lipoprotein-sorting protein [Candidatus Tectomicrobia bacterium]|nr:outer membrane lipoprotein-sorting protein [Candidatus Tectomicrobia bacterium]
MPPQPPAPAPSGLAAVPRRYAAWVVRWRWPVLVLSLLAALALGAFAARQHYHNPYEMWFLPDDPALVEFRQFTRQYGEEDLVVIAFRDPDGIFTNEALAAILELTERLEATPLVEKVTSVANYQHVQSRPEGGDDALSIQDLVRREELPLTEEELRRREALALAEPPIPGSLLPRHGRPDATAIVVRVRPTGENPIKVVNSIRAAVRDVEARHGYEMHLAGVPVVEHAFETFGRSETLTFTSALLAVVVVLLAAIFRSVAGVVLPCAVVLLAIVGALGVMAALGIWLNPLTTIMPQILVTVAIAEAVHIVATYVMLRRGGRPRAAAVVETVEHNFTACLVTSLTTAIGFASLTTVSLVPMRELGVGACAGVLLAFALTFTLLPAALAVWPEGRPYRRDAGAAVSASRLDAALAAFAGVVVRHPWPVIVGVGAVFAGLMSFAPLVRVETSYPNMFKPETELRRGLAFIEGRLGGSEDVEVSIDSGRSDGVKDPAFLAKVAAIQDYLGSLPYATQTFSVVDVLERMHDVMGDDPGGGKRLPDSAELAAQYLLMYTLGARDEDLKDRIDVDNRWTRVTARVRAQPARETQAMGRAIREHIRQRFPELRAVVTSRALLYTSMQEDLAANTITSFFTAFVPITVMLAVVFRSVRLAAVSVVPNILPIGAMVGLMGLLDIPLDPGSAMVASVAIGIVVDDTVHFLSRYRGSRMAGSDTVSSIRRTLGEVGRPVVHTTAILAAGFSVFSLSHFNFIAYFGTLAAVVIVLALLADLFLTPALLAVVDGRRLRVRGGVPGPHLARLPLVLVGAGVATLAITTPAVAQTAEDRGLAIMRRQEALNRGYGSEASTIRMTLVNANNDRSERMLDFRLLEGADRGGQGDGPGDRTLIVFRAPADIEGTALLTHQHRDRDDDQWLYMPALRRTKRIASASRSASFVGSEFSYEDLIPLDLAKYRFRYVRDDVVDRVAVWVVEAVPRAKDSGYSRLEFDVQQDNHQTVRTRFFDRNGELLKVARYDRWSRIDGRWWRAALARMENVQTRKVTTLETLSIRLQVPTSPRDFNPRALGD